MRFWPTTLGGGPDGDEGSGAIVTEVEVDDDASEVVGGADGAGAVVVAAREGGVVESVGAFKMSVTALFCCAEMCCPEVHADTVKPNATMVTSSITHCPLTVP